MLCIINIKTCYTKKDTMTCPFNSLHVIPSDEFDNHIYQCGFAFMKYLEEPPETCAPEASDLIVELNNLKVSKEKPEIKKVHWRELKKQKLNK